MCAGRSQNFTLVLQSRKGKLEGSYSSTCAIQMKHKGVQGSHLSCQAQGMVTVQIQPLQIRQIRDSHANVGAEHDLSTHSTHVWYHTNL